MAEPLQVELVAADRVVWSGEAVSILARTTEGEIGILSNHAPILSVLVEGVVELTTESDGRVVAAIDEGFLSVAKNRVSILAESAELSNEIDVEQARADLERAKGADQGDAAGAIRRAEARLRAVERAT